MRFWRGFLLIHLTAWYILVLSLWHLSISDARLSCSRFLSSFNILTMSWRILLHCLFNSLTLSLLTVELIRRWSSFCWFDNRSTTWLCIRWFLFLVKPIVFVAASVILARIFPHEQHSILEVLAAEVLTAWFSRCRVWSPFNYTLLLFLSIL